MHGTTNQNEVVRTNHLTAELKLSPKTGVDLGSLQGIGDDAKSREYGIDIGAPFNSVRHPEALSRP